MAARDTEGGSWAAAGLARVKDRTSSLTPSTPTSPTKAMRVPVARSHRAVGRKWVEARGREAVLRVAAPVSPRRVKVVL